ncbi:MAG: phospho-sugar mutase [Clostridia bacterium]|nr:phospho-sugar mutase [Clostridia bacterium]
MIPTACKIWAESPILTEQERARVREIANDPETALLYFSAPMSFGTAGLRSVMDMGPGCMNVYTVAHITQAIATLILRRGGAERGVAVAYDSRRNSASFARVAAQVMAANGIRVFLFDDIRPTPELSFAIRRLGCIAGINITASHNPKQYNGYKAYWEDGAQISPTQADEICAIADTLDVLGGASLMPYEQALADGLIRLLDKEFDQEYLDAVQKTAVKPQSVREVADRLSVVYTPLHGAGRRLVPEILRRIGLKHLYTVDEQMTPDGDFPTVKKPNPEYPDVFAGGIAIADRVHSDLVIATDPDADRIGVMCRGKDGAFFAVTGNQMGALLLDYVIRAAREAGTLTPDDYAVESIVSTDMAPRICEIQKVRIYQVPTGFKYIGEVIKNYEQQNRPGRFLIGFEESYGYLFGSYARDKDAVGAAMMICEMTAWYAKRGMTLGDALDELYRTYGFYKEGLIDVYMEGLSGIEKRKSVMRRLRQDPPREIGGEAVEIIADFSTGLETNVRTGAQKPSVLSDLDVVYYTLANGDKVVVRPSGTEPKIKMYLLCHGADDASVSAKIEAYSRTARSFCD